MADTWDPEFKDEALNKVYSGRGFSDPRGEFPRKDHHFKSSLNKEVVEGHKTSVDIGGGDPGLDAFGGEGQKIEGNYFLPGIGWGWSRSSDINEEDDIVPQYSDIQVQETKAGHKLILDDTTGGERVVLKHGNGSGIQLSADGSIVIRAKNNFTVAVDATGNIIIDGDLRISSKNLKLDVTGDLDMNVAGDWNVTVAGDKRESIYGSHRAEINGNRGEIVKGNKSKTVLGSETNTVLGASNNVTKGNHNLTVAGSSTFSISGVFKQSSEAEYTVASPSVNISAGDLSVLGAAGTVGGKNVIMYNYNMHTGHTVHAESMTADTFHGDLNGTAKRSNATSSQNYGEAATSGSSYSYTETAVDNTASYQPDGALMKQILQNSSRGVAEVTIDEGDYIKNKIDRTSKMGGIAGRKLTTQEARAKMKDVANRNNKEFLSAIIADGSISNSFSNKIPPAIGRTYSSGSVALLPPESGTGSSSKMIKGKREFTGFSPDPAYDPMAIDPRKGPFSINAKTLVGKGIPISTFLGSKGSPTNLGHLATIEERQALARQLLLQAEVIKFVRADEGRFKDYRIVVAEGLYKPHSGETLSTGSILDLARTGRAITYELYDLQNKISLEKTFEFAEHLAEYLFGYDKILLNFDSLNPEGDGGVHAQITVIMPEVDREYKIIKKVRPTTASGDTKDQGQKPSSAIQPDFELETVYNNETLSDTDLVEVLSEASAGDEIAVPEEEVADIIQYSLGAIRNRKVNKSLEILLATAARRSDIDKVVITSGKQPGTTGRRTGSTRHDTGEAADLYLIRKGTKLSMSNSSHRAIIARFVKEAARLGVKGGGMGVSYMGEYTMHLDTLGQNLGGGRFNNSVTVVWKSPDWFVNAMYGR